MWGRRPNNESAQDSPSRKHPEPAAAQPRANTPRPAVHAARPRPAEAPESRLGKRLTFRGEITGTEDLQVDGDFHGKIELKDNCLTIGPNARVDADVHALSIYIAGRLKGNVQAPERIELRKTGSLEGDVVTAGIVIEEGAIFRGSIDIVRPDAKERISERSKPSLAKKPEPAKPQPKTEVAEAATAG